MLIYKVITTFALVAILHGCKDQISDADQMDVSIVRFTVNIDTHNPTESDSPHLVETDWGVLMLPKTYSDLGKPTRLIIYCHGGGGTVNYHSSQIENYPLVHYFVSLGFAVMDMSGMPESLSSRLNIDHYRVMGNFRALRSYEKGYEYVISKFNLRKDGCLLSGGSNGGLTSVNLVLHTKIHFLAQEGFAPLLNIKDNAWNIPTGALSGGEFSEYQNRANIIRLYGMKDVKTIEDLKKAVYETKKVGKYDPVQYLKDNPNIKYPIHFKIWSSIDDPAVLINYVEEFTALANTRDEKVSLNILPNGGHAPESTGGIVGTYEYRGATFNLYKTFYDAGQFFLLFLY